jgi:protein-tyrosine phosphatase
MMNILVVCTANICRSPTGEEILRNLIAEAGLEADISVDSAGTKAGSGTPPDVRSRLLAEGKGYSLQGITSRPLKSRDYRDFDLILAMDEKHRKDMRLDCPLEHMDKIKLFLDFTPGLVGTSVPDPYYGEAKDFVIAFDLIEKGGKGLLAAIDDQKPYLGYRDRR